MGQAILVDQIVTLFSLVSCNFEHLTKDNSAAPQNNKNLQSLTLQDIHVTHIYFRKPYLLKLNFCVQHYLRFPSVFRNNVTKLCFSVDVGYLGLFLCFNWTRPQAEVLTFLIYCITFAAENTCFIL